MRFRVTRAKANDLDLLVTHRLRMWIDIHPEWKEEVKESEKSTRAWISKKLTDRSLIGFIARSPDGSVAGSGCVWVREEQPRPNYPKHEVPYLMSMYTEKPYRHKGVAKLIVAAASGWCKEHGYRRVVLHLRTKGGLSPRASASNPRPR